MASQATPHLFTLGTGTTLYDHIWHRILQEVQHELVLVTCFWASSESLTTTRSLLIQLSELALQRSTRIRVRICFSSLSLFQKLFHTRSEDGHIYDPHCYVRRLGLPPPKKLSGVELQVKSIFIIPFSVMHPKVRRIPETCYSHCSSSIMTPSQQHRTYPYPCTCTDGLIVHNH